MKHKLCYFLAFILSYMFAIAALAGTGVMKTKSINYRGGIVHFSIPESWKEEYEPKGGATFYEDTPDSGTLRVNVMSFDSPNTPAEEMAMQIFSKKEFKIIGKNILLEYKVKEAVEGNETLKIHIWSVAVPVVPNTVRLITFHHTVLSSVEKTEKIQQEITFLHKSIESAIYSLESGVLGEYYQ